MSIFKSTLKPYIRRQINTRQSLLSSENRPSYFPRFVSGKAPWVKMSSFVDYKNSDALARKYILYGGTAYSENDEVSLRGGINVKKGAYGELGNRKKFGSNPMPGIEDVEIRSLAAYGSLREATVTFYAWDKNQLEDLERLYMRPGYYVLIEWGWSMFLDSNIDSKDDVNSVYDPEPNKIEIPDITKNISKTMNYAGINIFDKNLTEERIYKELESKRFKYSGNYDGVLGVVRNFNWEFLPNGGYQCKTVIISIGDIIDTLKISSVTSYDRITDGSNKTSDDKNYHPTTMELILDNLNLSDKNNLVQQAYKKSVESLEDEELKAKIQSDILFIANGQSNSNKVVSGYIQLSYLIFILGIQNNLFNEKSEPLLKIEIPINSEKNVSNGLCLASEDSVSLDPSKCIIQNSKATFVTGKPEGFRVSTNPGEPEFREFLLPDESGLGLIGNIYFNILYIKETYQNILKQNNEVCLGPFIKELLNGANSVLGNINEFNIFVIDNTATIIDIHYTEQKNKTNKNKKFEINLSGNNTAVRTSKIQSKIFPQQASIIAIAAQDRENVAAVNSSTNVAFNKDITNRIRRLNINIDDVKGSDITEEDKIKQKIESEKQKIIENVLMLRSYFEDMVNNQYHVASETAASMASVLNSVILKVNTDTNYRAVIPISLEIELDGLGGFTIGEIFRVNQDILPTSYNDRNLGFIITNLRNSISRGDWKTTLVTQICLLDQEDLYNSSVKVGKNSIVSSVSEYLRKKADEFYSSILSYNMLAAYCAEYLGYRGCSITIEGVYKKNVIENLSNFNVPNPIELFNTKKVNYPLPINNNNTKEQFLFTEGSLNIRKFENSAFDKMVRLGNSNKYEIDSRRNYIFNNFFNDLGTQACLLLSDVTYQDYANISKNIINSDKTPTRTLFLFRSINNNINHFYLNSEGKLFANYNTVIERVFEDVEKTIDGDTTQNYNKAKILSFLEKQIYNSSTYKTMFGEVKNKFDNEFNNLKKGILSNNSYYDFRLLAFGETNYNTTSATMKSDLSYYKEGIRISLGKKYENIKVFTDSEIKNNSKEDKQAIGKINTERSHILSITGGF